MAKFDAFGNKKKTNVSLGRKIAKSRRRAEKKKQKMMLDSKIEV